MGAVSAFVFRRRRQCSGTSGQSGRADSRTLVNKNEKHSLTLSRFVWLPSVSQLCPHSCTATSREHTPRPQSEPGKRTDPRNSHRGNTTQLGKSEHTVSDVQFKCPSHAQTRPTFSHKTFLPQFDLATEQTEAKTAQSSRVLLVFCGSWRRSGKNRTNERDRTETKPGRHGDVSLMDRNRCGGWCFR